MAVVQAQMLNYTPGAMSFHQQKHDWSGFTLGSYPNQINANEEASFVHHGIPSMGSYGAVIYSTGVADNCAWILAWHVPGDGTNNRVYVEIGPKSKYPPEPTDYWATIKESLDKSSNKSYYTDENNRAKASASITSGNIATISVTFDIIN